jgi:phenylpropionate dioxygenase-like ring-hydroxylating dioxygenase large terminal subunit
MTAWRPDELRALVEPSRVHRALYTDPGIFELELDRIFGHAWLYAAHESEIKAPGDFVRTKLGRWDAIVVRGDDGAFHVLHNRCAHRGARFCVTERGNARSFICPYHGWSYRRDGRLQGVPHRRSYLDSFSLDDPAHHLAAAAEVETYRGFVFAKLVPSTVPLRAHLGPMTDAIDNLIDRAPDGEIEICTTPLRVAYRGNWKLHHENASDVFHPSFVHASSVAAAARSQAGSSRIDGDQTREQLLGNAWTRREWEGVELVGLPGGHAYMGGFYKSGLLAPNVAGDPVRERYRDALAARHGPERTAQILGLDRFNNLIFPNVNLNAQYHQLRVVHPLAVDRTLVTAYCFRLKGAPEEIYHRAVRYLTNLSSPASMISSDDFEIFERCQAGLGDPDTDWIDIARGLGKDRAGPGGGHVGVATELPIRTQFEAWLALMTGPQPP